MTNDTRATPYDWFLYIAAGLAVAIVIIVAFIGYEVADYPARCSHGTLKPECIWPAH